MIVKDVMTHEVISVTPDVQVGSVSNTLIEKKIHGIPVVENGKPIGIITETDFFTKGNFTVYLPAYIDLLKKDADLQSLTGIEGENLKTLLNARAEDIMSTPCVTVNENADIHEFLGVVKGRKLSSVPVVNDAGMLSGIITVSDVISLLKMD